MVNGKWLKTERVHLFECIFGGFFALIILQIQINKLNCESQLLIARTYINLYVQLNVCIYWHKKRGLLVDCVCVCVP